MENPLKELCNEQQLESARFSQSCSTSKKWLGFRGKIIDHPFYDICRSQIDIEIDGDWRKLLEDMQGFHWMTCYGDYLREVGYALKKVGIEWHNITTGRTV